MSIPLPIVIALLVHWWASVFLQSFFLHRYGAHGMFTMSRFWQRFFHLMTYLAQGSSYLNPAAYAVLHRMHHAFSDSQGDPHSPKLQPNPLRMMWQTLGHYRDVLHSRTPIEPRFCKDLVRWPALDGLAQSRFSTIGWVLVYAAFYLYFANAWWQYFLISVHALMGPIHGAIVNYLGHKLGYRNHALSDASRNTLWFDLVTLGELFQNNHHARPQSPNFGTRRFELDPTWPLIRIMASIGIVRLKTSPG